MSKFTAIYEKYSQKGQIIGIGTGKTISAFIEEVKFDKTKEYVPTSETTARLLQEKGVKVRKLEDTHQIDVYFDSADFYDEFGQLIKGGGAALVKEKIAMIMSKNNVIIVQKRKFCEDLESKLVPMEIFPAAFSYVRHNLEKFNLLYKIRYFPDSNDYLVTENGNYILDVIYDRNFLDKCHKIPGIIEHGSFDSMFFCQIEKIDE